MTIKYVFKMKYEQNIYCRMNIMINIFNKLYISNSFSYIVFDVRINTIKIKLKLCVFTV